jgi:hypothetical protein
LTNNNQTLRIISATIATGVSTSNASTPSTSSGPPMVENAMAVRPAACAKRAVRRRGRRPPRKSATGIMNAVESDPKRSLAEPAIWKVEPSKVPPTGLPSCSQSKAYMAMRKRLARMPVAPAA